MKCHLECNKYKEKYVGKLKPNFVRGVGNPSKLRNGKNKNYFTDIIYRKS